MSRAKSHKPNPKTGYENIILTHPLRMSDFALPEVRKQLIKMEYERLRNLESQSGPTINIPKHANEVHMGRYVPTSSTHNTRSSHKVQQNLPLLANTNKVQRRAAFISFSDTEEDLIFNVLRRGQDEDDVLADFYGNSMTRAQIRCLEGKNWLNSTVIDYIFNIWNERSNIVDSKHVFISTYFMDRLRDGGRYNFSNVRDWFNKGRDIKDDSIMYIPVNISNTHWTLLVIDMRRKSLKYYDGLRGKLLYIYFFTHTMT
jgi:Ulp1 protease family, C-terminal catalytic domain